MKIFYSVDEIDPGQDTVLTVGSFDGVHRGHQRILEELEKQSRECECTDALITFHPHPKEVLGKTEGKPIELLTPLDDKLEILEKLGLSMVIIIPFTPEFSKTRYQDFVKNILIDRARMKKIVIGYDHSFGRNREGHAQELEQMGNKYGFSVTVIQPFHIGNEIVGSRKIRKFLKEGNVVEAAELLGRRYSLSGHVVKGNNRGKILGFPTANIQPAYTSKLIPARGVYAVDVLLDGKRYAGMMNIGNRPTFNFDPLTLEVHIFNFSGLIYDSNLRIEFKQFIRKERKFSEPEDLKQQMIKDKEICIKI
ncbi:MAG: bifunctional riboflavin kinase/FAD synthetase [Calditrichaeota bacterium]|nr:bifunctional riboflavin kinase/FAD synthetase [Calditrichota bacterium]RQV92590.1 MAG: bifunctional riboflavin kinase/FAD synthetase [bacterium]RQW07588.1 MAG: bifunctional riboflavin kinase/FAD synthetase [Calditrichota bacterium]